MPLLCRDAVRSNRASHADSGHQLWSRPGGVGGGISQIAPPLCKRAARAKRALRAQLRHRSRFPKKTSQPTTRIKKELHNAKCRKYRVKNGAAPFFKKRKGLGDPWFLTAGNAKHLFWAKRLLGVTSGGVKMGSFSGPRWGPPPFGPPRGAS